MKLNKSYFMGLFITFLMVGIAGIVAGVTIVTNPDSEILHRGRLHTLYFGNSNDVGIKVQSGASYLSVLNGLIVGVNLSASNASGSMIGGGDGNQIRAQNAGIAGGQSNQINNGGDYSAIGGGNGNILGGENSVVAGGSGNRAGNGAVIVGGENNEGESKGVVLGGLNNKAEEKNNLVMGSGAKGSEGSFVWSDTSTPENVPENSARIDALNGVLIGTAKTVSGVRLVVNGAVKLGSGNNNFTGEMSVDGNGCIWASDGITGHVLGKGSESGCMTVTGQCLFGSTLLQNGDKKKAYLSPYSENCESIAIEIMCNGSKLCKGTECGYSYNKYYPYCYGVSKSNENNREYPDRYRILNS